MTMTGEESAAVPARNGRAKLMARTFYKMEGGRLRKFTKYLPVNGQGGPAAVEGAGADAEPAIGPVDPSGPLPLEKLSGDPNAPVEERPARPERDRDRGRGRERGGRERGGRDRGERHGRDRDDRRGEGERRPFGRSRDDVPSWEGGRPGRSPAPQQDVAPAGAVYTDAHGSPGDSPNRGEAKPNRGEAKPNRGEATPSTARSESEPSLETERPLAGPRPERHRSAQPRPFTSHGAAGLAREAVEEVPEITVVLRTRNCAAAAPGLVAAVRRQKTQLGVEILAIDFGSSDGTLDALRGAGARVISMPQEAASTTACLDRAMSEARGDLVAFLGLGAAPGADNWLDRLTSPLLDHPDVAIVSGGLNATGASEDYDRFRVRTSPDGAGEERRFALGDGDPAQALHLCTDNFSCRKDVWKRIKFGSLPAGGEKRFVLRVLEAGFKKAQMPAAAATVERRDAFVEGVRKRFLDALFSAALVRHRNADDPVRLPARWVRDTVADLREISASAPSPASRVRWALAAPLTRAVEHVGRYLGSRRKN